MRQWERGWISRNRRKADAIGMENKQRTVGQPWTCDTAPWCSRFLLCGMGQISVAGVVLLLKYLTSANKRSRELLRLAVFRGSSPCLVGFQAETDGGREGLWRKGAHFMTVRKKREIEKWKVQGTRLHPSTSCPSVTTSNQVPSPNSTCSYEHIRA